jgi:hypothetical protein
MLLKRPCASLMLLLASQRTPKLRVSAGTHLEVVLHEPGHIDGAEVLDDGACDALTGIDVAEGGSVLRSALAQQKVGERTEIDITATWPRVGEFELLTFEFITEADIVTSMIPGHLVAFLKRIDDGVGEVVESAAQAEEAVDVHDGR